MSKYTIAVLAYKESIKKIDPHYRSAYVIGMIEMALKSEHSPRRKCSEISAMIEALEVLDDGST